MTGFSATAPHARISYTGTDDAGDVQVVGEMAMETTNDAWELSPSIMLINGREYVLIQHLLERVQIADARLLWRDSVFVWGLLLIPLNVANGEFFDTNGWVLFGISAAIFAGLAMRFFGRDRSAAISPVTVTEEDRSGTGSQLAISTRRERTINATVHTDMADFLLRTVGTDRTRRARLRREIPAELRDRRARWHELNLLAAAIATIAAIVVIEVAR